MQTYFQAEETECSKKFDTDFEEETDLFLRLLDNNDKFVKQLGGSVKDNQYPEVTIQIFLVNNVTLMSAAFNLLRTGYIGVSYAVLRLIAESLSLGLSFYEFPEEEIKYRKDPTSFYEKLKSLGYARWIQGALQRIDKEGKKLTGHGIESLLETLIYKGIAEEASQFIHASSKHIRSITSMEGQGDVYGPNYPSRDKVRIIFLKLLHCVVLNLMATDKIFLDFIKDKDTSLINEATLKINSWNKELKDMESYTNT